MCVCCYVHTGLGASVACGAGLKALQLSGNLVWGMSVHAVSEETGLLVDPRAPFYQLLELNGSGMISPKAHFTPVCCFKGWDHHEMLSLGVERAAAGLALLGPSRCSYKRLEDLLVTSQPASAKCCDLILGDCSLIEAALPGGPQLL